jgi:hypothetical protein
MQHILSGMLTRKELKFGIVFSGTKFNGAYEWLPDKRVYGEFDMDVLQKYLQFLVKIKNSGKPIPSNFIVLDDIISSINQKSKQWKSFIAAFRHYNVTLFVTTQHVNQCEPLLREQADYAYIFELHTKASIEASHKSYGNLLTTPKAWQAFLSAHTKVEYTCIVWSKHSRPVITERYKRYRAPAKRKEVKFEF